jgi:integrase
LVCYEGKEHRVPLSDGAMTILEKMAELRSGDYLFPGQAPGKPRSNMTINMMSRG